MTFLTLTAFAVGTASVVSAGQSEKEGARVFVCSGGTSGRFMGGAGTEVEVIRAAAFRDGIEGSILITRVVSGMRD